MNKQTEEERTRKEKLAAVITESFHDQRFIMIRMYNQQQGEYELTGIVTKIDQQLRRIKVSHDKGADWIPCDDMLSAIIVNR